MRILVFGVLALAACNTPPLRFMDVEPEQVTVAGSQFDVYLKPDEAFVVRTNRRALPDAAEVLAAAATAAEVASGCEALTKKIKGDQAMVRIPLKCR
ncbi:MAG: hypothetical protein AAF245_11330 [Pseudomonadota bacterium]